MRLSEILPLHLMEVSLSYINGSEDSAVVKFHFLTVSVGRYIRALLHDGTTAREAFYILTSSAALSHANLSQVRGFVASSPEQQEL
jgi:hypothetical protein